jgi:hypothetical protein
LPFAMSRFIDPLRWVNDPSFNAAAAHNVRNITN